MSTAIYGMICLSLVLSATGQEASTPAQSRGSIDLTPKTVDFVAQRVGTTSSPKAVILKNNSEGPVKIGDVLVSGIDFSQANSCGQVIAAGATCEIQVVFKPATVGERLGTLNVQMLEAGSHIVVLSGSGVE